MDLLLRVREEREGKARNEMERKVNACWNEGGRGRGFG